MVTATIYPISLGMLSLNWPTVRNLREECVFRATLAYLSVCKGHAKDLFKSESGFLLGIVKRGGLVRLCTKTTVYKVWACFPELSWASMLMPLESRIRIRQFLDKRPPQDLAIILKESLAKTGNSSLMTERSDPSVSGACYGKSANDADDRKRTSMPSLWRQRNRNKRKHVFSGFQRNRKNKKSNR